jgi:hypothetical protein
MIQNVKPLRYADNTFFPMRTSGFTSLLGVLIVMYLLPLTLKPFANTVSGDVKACTMIFISSGEIYPSLAIRSRLPAISNHLEAARMRPVIIAVLAEYGGLVDMASAYKAMGAISD